MQNIQSSVMNAWEQASAFLALYGLGALGGIVMLVVGWKAAVWASRAVDAGLARGARRQFVAAVVERDGTLGIEPYGLVLVGHGAIMISLLRKRVRSRRVGLGIVWIEADRHAGVFDRAVVIVLVVTNS